MDLLKRKIADAIEVLEEGGVIIYPTDTVYGLGADIENEVACRRICNLKGRDFDKPLSIACKKSDILRFAEPDFLFEKLANKYLPGPLTLVVKKKENSVPEWITKNEWVGLRIIDDPVVKGIVNEFGPIVTTSANLSGKPNPNCVENPMKSDGLQAIDPWILENVDLVIDNGVTRNKGASTVVKVFNGEITVLRQGVLDVR